MAKMLLVLCLGIFSAACDRVHSVQAANEPASAQSTPVHHLARFAVSSERPAGITGDGHVATGNLTKADLVKNIFTIRLANGVEQTFQFDDSTPVNGSSAVAGSTPLGSGKNNWLRNGVRKHSQVTVEWQNLSDSGPTRAASIDLE